MLRRELLALLGVLGVATGCQVVRWRGRRLERKARRHGYRTSSHRLGDAIVRVHAGGTGAPLLLLHGFGGSAVWQWSPQLEPFAIQHRVLAPDLLWFGQSTSSAPPSLARQIDAMLALLDERGVQRAHIVGHSYGGIVAWELAARHPDRVEKLVLVDSPGDAWTPEDHAALLARLGVDRAAEVFVPRTPDDVRRLLAIAYADPPRISDFIARQVIAELYDPHREAQIVLVDELDARGLAARPEAPSPKATMKLVWGAADPVFPLAVGQRLAARTGAAIVAIPNARHQPNAEHARRFDAEVLRFLRAE